MEFQQESQFNPIFHVLKERLEEIQEQKQMFQLVSNKNTNDCLLDC